MKVHFIIATTQKKKIRFFSKYKEHFGVTFSLSSLRKLLATVAIRLLSILVPSGRAPFGQHQESRSVTLTKRIAALGTRMTSIVHDILITLATGVPGGVGDSEWIVSRRLVARALDPADCFIVSWTRFVTVDPPSCSRTACRYLVHLGFFTPFCEKKKSRTKRILW